MSRARVLVVRPEPSRPLGAFYRNLGLTMLATHLASAGMEPVLADLTFGSWASALGHGARAAAFSLYIDDFAEGADEIPGGQGLGIAIFVAPAGSVHSQTGELESGITGQRSNPTPATVSTDV